jgi:peptidyl-prolyl cis-trans isomerase B (cyclophilin B)
MKRMNYRCITVLTILVVVSTASLGQEATKPNQPAEPQKANARPVDVPPVAPEPFDGASVEKMASQCVTLHTELGTIEIEMIPETAPEAVRNFLNLSATGALDTTTFSRTVKGFIIQGGNLSTSEKWSAELAKRMSRTLPDEPGLIAHVRGIVSMARTEEPNSATTHFFILVGEGRHLDSKFAAFGRVKKGIEIADAINQAPAEGEKPVKPVKIERAVVSSCGK